MLGDGLGWGYANAEGLWGLGWEGQRVGDYVGCVYEGACAVAIYLYCVRTIS